jgi:hypothetical protein
MIACFTAASVICHFLLPPGFMSGRDNYPDTGGI